MSAWRTVLDVAALLLATAALIALIASPPPWPTAIPMAMVAGATVTYALYRPGGRRDPGRRTS